MRAALNDAGMNADDIDYINVHGTSTPLGDIAETKATRATDAGRKAGHPLTFTTEPEE
jgi:3-oxoacyl-(acyl-carrier-protein) synthase